MKMLKRGTIVLGLMVATTLFSGCSIGETWDVLWGHNDTEEATIPATAYDPDAVQVDESVSAPKFTQDLEGSQKYAINDKAEELRVEAAEEAEGEVTYQWYVNTVDSNGGGEQVVGATTNTYTPDTSKEGRSYYFVVATHAIGKKINLSTSKVAEIIIDPDQEPAQEKEEEKPKKGWIETENGWTYYENDGNMAKNKAVEVEGKKYYFSDEGIMQTGWVKPKVNWYYFGEDGAMWTSTFIEDGGKKYCVDQDGKMRTSAWIEDNGQWLYATEDGSLAVGWVELKGDWYSFTADGVMRSNVAFEGKWLNPDGRLAH